MVIVFFFVNHGFHVPLVANEETQEKRKGICFKQLAKKVRQLESSGDGEGKLPVKWHEKRGSGGEQETEGTGRGRDDSICSQIGRGLNVQFGGQRSHQRREQATIRVPENLRVEAPLQVAPPLPCSLALPKLMLGPFFAVKATEVLTHTFVKMNLGVYEE